MRHFLIIACAAGLLFALPPGGRAWAEDTATSAQTPKPGSVNPNLGNGPAVQKSVPSSASPATTTKHTGATNQSSTVKSMNKNAEKRIETEGK
jgi:hypothetical protein